MGFRAWVLDYNYSLVDPIEIMKAPIFNQRSLSLEI